MKTLRVSEATRTQLDWLVAKCEGFRPVYTNEWVTPRHPEDPRRVCVSVGTTGRPFLTPYEPSSSPMQMQPIIEREKIATNWRVTNAEGGGYWQAENLFTDTYGFIGPTALIAAARCYVASKLGETVEVPEELT